MIPAAYFSVEKSQFRFTMGPEGTSGEP